MDRPLLRQYAASGVIIAGLYLLNRFLLIPLTGWRLLAWHGADFLAGGGMLCLLAVLGMALAQVRPALAERRRGRGRNFRVAKPGKSGYNT